MPPELPLHKRDGWSEYWDESKLIGPGVPAQWWRARHDASGYSIGEVGAGRYMAADNRNEGIVDETGDWCAWSNPVTAMEYVENVLANRQQ